MGKVLAGRIDCDVLDGIFIQNGYAGSFIKPKNKCKLTSYITKFDISEENVFIRCDLTDLKVYNIAVKLSEAIDKNSVSEIKILKQKYGSQKEFLKAKDYLNQCVKEVWDIFEKDYDSKKVPTAALKTLGITNIPTLDFLLNNSLQYYEKDNGTTTVEIIKSIINNENTGYSFEDICNYLKLNRTKFNYNENTKRFLAQTLNYDIKKLKQLGIEDFKPNFKQNLQRTFIYLKNHCKNLFYSALIKA